ncbi:L-aspartate oxidase, partial [Streptomyces sp. Act-28]
CSSMISGLMTAARARVQRVMTLGAGVLRSAASLAEAAEQLDAIHQEALGGGEGGGHKTAEPGVESWETTNLLCVARVLVAAARRREETRGCHWREDHPDRDDDAWRRHLVVRLAPDRGLDVRTTDTQDFPPTVQPAEQAAARREQHA